MRPPTPRLRINSEDFIDSDTKGSPSDLYPSYANSSSLSINNACTSSKNNNNNNKTYQNSVTNTSTTNNTTNINQHYNHHQPALHNANVNSLVDDTIAMLVADSDPQDFSVL